MEIAKRPCEFNRPPDGLMQLHPAGSGKMLLKSNSLYVLHDQTDILPLLEKVNDCGEGRVGKLL